MSFVTPALLAGTLLVGLPIVLHLVMRREPKHVVFPALQFVRKRQAANQTRLRLRHWLLLMLRCAVIACLAIALARPSLRGAGGGSGKDAPIAAALVVDNSLRMQYLHANQTRLEAAQELGTWLLDQLPAETPFAVADLAGRRSVFAPDKSSAQLKLSRITSSGAVRPLHEVVQDVAGLLAEKEGHRAEIYVATDLATPSWSDETLEALKELVDSQPDTTLYLLDVGVSRAENVGLSGLQLSEEAPTAGKVVDIEVAVRASQAVREADVGDEHLVELFVRDAEGNDVKRGEQLVTISDSGTASISFSLPGFDEGTHQGYARLASDDALSCDNTQFFTIDARPSRKVALLAPREELVLFLRQALVPGGSSEQNSARYRTDFFRIDEATALAFNDYDAVCLLDPPPLASTVWEDLVDYVREGGGLGIFFGREAEGRREDFNTAPAQELLPGRLRWVSRDATSLRPGVLSHPVLASLSDYANDIPWAAFPVLKYWELEGSAGGVYTVANYANGAPALLERQLGRGRVLTMTTPLSDAAHRDPWNLLPTGPNPWPFLAISTGIVDYLAGARDSRLNYRVGESAVVRLGPLDEVGSFVLQTPDGDAVRQSLVSGEREIVVAATEMQGNYRLQAGGAQGRLDRGFSVNVPSDTGRVERVEFRTIEQAIGRDRVFLARTPEELEVRVGIGRVGHELFPWLIGAVVLALGAEHVLANRFYRQQA